MTTAVRQWLEAFDALTDAEKREAAAELIRRTVNGAGLALSDAELTATAEAIFLDLDAREAADAQS